MKRFNSWKWGSIVAVVIALMLWARSCGVKSVTVKAGKTDTAWLKPDTVHFYDIIPEPYAVIKKIQGKTIIDTVIVEKPLPEDTIGVYNDYFRTVVYSYQDRVKYGLLTVDDTISQNMFLGRGVVFVADSIPIVTNTVLINEPKKLVLYLGASAFGNRNDLLYGAGLDLSLKGLNDRQYGVGITYTKGNNFYYGINYRIPIRLKK